VVRLLLTAIFELFVRIFFRRVEVAGTERIPDGPALFVVNHPNALMDPIVVFRRSPRQVTFVAKSTLWKMPGVSAIVKAFDALPVYRRQDTTDQSQNAKTFKKARELMQRNVAICIFPEGVSHSDPQLRQIKTGAARIALGAQVEGLKIVPAGLYFLSKMTFRSSALLYFSEPIDVPQVELEDGDAPRDKVNALTEKVKAALDQVTLQSEKHEAIQLVERAERIFRSATEEDITGDDVLEDRFTLRKRLLDGYHSLRADHSEALEQVQTRVDRYYAELDQLRLEPEHLAPHEFSAAGSARYALLNGLYLLALLVPALFGLVTHYATYRLLGGLANRLAVKDKEGGGDMLATVKVFGGMLLFPATWLLIALVTGFTISWAAAGVAFFIALPGSGYCALLFTERIEKVAGAARAMAAFYSSKGTLARLHAERVAIREDITRLGNLTG